MTLNDLKNEVLSLMFETELDSHAAFVAAANRALMEIHSERDRAEELKLYKRALAPKERRERILHKGGESLTESLSCKAFSFAVTGIGKLLFTDGEKTEEIEFSGVRSVIKRIVSTGVAFLEFTGDFDYEIYELSSFDYLVSDAPADVPLFSEYERLDLRQHDPLFLALIKPPTDRYGKALANIKADAATLIVPSEFEGQITVLYKRMPKRILEEEIDVPLDVEPEVSHLLALRCAAYLLLDDNEGLSEYYFSLYKSGMSAVKLYNRKDTSAEYCDVLGWA